MLNELKTIRDYVRLATSQFNSAGLVFGHGTDNAWDEAVYLILHALHLPEDSTNAVLDARLMFEEREKIYHLIQKRIKERKPAPYLTHEAWFAGLPFYVDERVLIPRSSIAELISNQFSPWISPEKITNILDLCTGSGCIAIACAEALPEARIVATDISKDALDVARINLDRYKLNDNVTLLQSDLFENIGSQQFDMIISNPPYVDAEDLANLPPEYQHEPKLALEAGQDGLEIVKKILQQAKNYLTEEGVLIMEVGNSEKVLIEQFPEIPFTWLEFERGDTGVFLLTKNILDKFL